MEAPAGKSAAWLVVILAVVALAVTNPSEPVHRTKIAHAARNAAAEDGFWGAMMAASGATDVAVELIPLEYHNYLVFSTVTCKGDRVSIGFLGNVMMSH